MTYERILDGLKRFGATERDICIQGTGVLPEQIREKVVIAPLVGAVRPAGPGNGGVFKPFGVRRGEGLGRPIGRRGLYVHENGHWRARAHGRYPVSGRDAVPEDPLYWLGRIA